MVENINETQSSTQKTEGNEMTNRTENQTNTSHNMVDKISAVVGLILLFGCGGYIAWTLANELEMFKEENRENLWFAIKWTAILLGLYFGMWMAPVFPGNNPKNKS